MTLGPLAARSFFWRRLSTRGPMNPRKAGSRVRAAIMVNEHADGGGDGQPVEEGDPEGEHAEQGDADDDPGEQHGPARGVDGVDDRRLEVVAGDQALAVPGHDEQGVVDPHPEADQQDQLGRELAAS